MAGLLDQLRDGISSETFFRTTMRSSFVLTCLLVVISGLVWKVSGVLPAVLLLVLCGALFAVQVLSRRRRARMRHLTRSPR